ncbi:ABC transporter ATP-binding protein [Roseburia hominis]
MREGIKSILRLNRYLFLGNKWLYVSHGFMSLLWCFAPFLLAFLVSLLMDFLSAGDMPCYLAVLAVYTVLTYVNIYYAWKSGIVEVKVTSYVEKTLQMNTLSRILKEKQGKCEEVGKMVDILENDFAVLERMLLVQMEFLCNIFSFLGYFFLVLRIHVYLAIFGFLPIVILGSLIGYFGEKLKERYQNARESSIDFSVMAAKIVENHEIFQYMGDRKSLLSAFAKKCELRGRDKLRKNRYLFCVNYSMQAVDQISVLLILVLVAILCEMAEWPCGVPFGILAGKGAITAGTLTLFVNSIHNGFSFLQLYKEIVMALKMTEASMERVCELLELTWQEMPQALGGQKREEEEKEMAEGNLSLHFVDFKMCAEDQEHEFWLRPGEMMVVSGGNSSGKSYFLDCIAGYRPYRGRIERNFSKRARIGYLSQNVALFQASLKENVTLFDSSENPGEAFAKSNLTGNAGNWEVMSEESIGVSGKRLSEGQRQRTAIARALVNGKNMLLLDDPFLFLDKENRRQILENVRSMNRTTVIVSNDENVIREADVHVTLENWRILKIK